MKTPPLAASSHPAMPDMIDIGDVACEAMLLETGGPALRPIWAVPKKQGSAGALTDTARNPLLRWETMAQVQIWTWRLRDVVLDAATMLLLQDGRVIRQSNYHRAPAELAAVSLQTEKIVPLPPWRPVLLCGDAWATNHYHFLNHALPAIDATLERFGVGGVVLAAPPLRPVHEAVLRVLGHDTAPRVTLEAGRQYAIEDALFCSFSVGTADFAPSPLIHALHARLAAEVPDNGLHRGKIYISRQKDTHRNASGEPELEHGLRRRGFAIAHPARMTIQEQINLFRQARLVVGPHGAGLANVSFCRPGTVLYEFLPAHFIDSSILNLAIRATMRPWIDAFPGDGAAGDHIRDWALDVPAILARVDEIDGRGGFWRRFF